MIGRSPDHVASTLAGFRMGLAAFRDYDPARAAEFAAGMKELETVRRRDGALSWGLYSDPAAAGNYREEFLVESWLEHLRQHERVTVSDQRIQVRIEALHKGPGVPRVTHYLAEERG